MQLLFVVAPVVVLGVDVVGTGLAVVVSIIAERFVCANCSKYMTVVWRCFSKISLTDSVSLI